MYYRYIKPRFFKEDIKIRENRNYQGEIPEEETGLRSDIDGNDSDDESDNFKVCMYAPLLNPWFFDYYFQTQATSLF